MLEGTAVSKSMVMVVIGGIIINALVSSPAFLPPLLGRTLAGAGDTAEIFISAEREVLEIVSDEVLNSFRSRTIWRQLWREPRVAAIGLLLNC